MLYTLLREVLQEITAYFYPMETSGIFFNPINLKLL